MLNKKKLKFENKRFTYCDYCERNIIDKEKVNSVKDEHRWFICNYCKHIRDVVCKERPGEIYCNPYTCFYNRMRMRFSYSELVTMPVELKKIDLCLSKLPIQIKYREYCKMIESQFSQDVSNIILNKLLEDLYPKV